MHTTLLALLQSFAVAEAAYHSIPLVKSRIPGTYTGLKSRQSGQAAASETEFFWFGNFSVGAAQNALLLLDTGSPDLLFNKGKYKPGSGSKDLRRTFSISFGTTNPDGSGFESVSGEVFSDSVTLPGTKLTVSAQPLGSATRWSPNTKPAFPVGDGLIGFGDGSSLGDGVVGWFSNLCSAQQVSECRFGLAFGTDGTGTQYYGGVEDGFKEKLVTVPIDGIWSFSADLVVGGSNATTVQSGVSIQLDSGTGTILGPLDQVQALFDAAGITAVQETVNNGQALAGYYSCDNPPQVGFQFNSSQPFYVEKEGLKFNSTGNKCRSVIEGLADMSSWLVGQAWMEGKYVDHNRDAQTMGFASLK